MVITTVLQRWRSQAQDDDGHIISLILIACDVYLLCILSCLDDGSIIRWSLTNYQEVFSLSMHRCESSSCWDTMWWSGVIGSMFKYNGCKTVAHAQYSGYTWRAKHIQIWPRNTETERSSVNHIVDMINIAMFTNETTPSHVMIGHGLVDLDHVIT